MTVPVDALRRAPLVRPMTLVVAVTTLALLVWQLLMPLAPDVAWLMTVSERILAGEQLYTQIFETNPPLAGLLYMPPVLVGRMLGISPDPLVAVQTVLFALLGTGLAARIVHRYRLLGVPELFWPLAMMLVGASWGIEFGQREQYALIAVLPVLVATAARIGGARFSWPMIIVLALLGGLCAAIKPHFVLALVIPAAYAAYRRRSILPLFAPELVLAAAVFLAFWGWTAVALPAYFSQMMPELAAAYLPDRRPLWQLMLSLPVAEFLCLALLGAALYRREIVSSALLATLASGAIAFFIVYLMQGKGFYYHPMPAFALMGLAVLGAFTERQGADSRLLDRAVPLIVATVFVILPQHYVVRVADSRLPMVEALAPYGPGLRIANITHEIRAAEPFVRIVGGEYINSSPALINALSAWRLKFDGVTDPKVLARAEAVEALDRVRLREDFKREPPDVVITSTDGFDWLKWAKRDPELAAILGTYRHLASIWFGDFELLLLASPSLKAPATP